MSEEVIKTEDNKNKYKTAQEFVGWKSDDGLLEVVDIYGKTKSKIALFKVICHKCKEDKELFPDGYFVSLKGNLLNGKKPCGCSKKPEWSKDQFVVLARRAAKDRFIVHGLSEEFHGQNTKLNLECTVDGHKWSASITSVINMGSGCPKCSGNTRLTEQEALDRCREICNTENYEHIGFVDGYKNNRSRFEYMCQKHGKQNVSYDSFVTQGTRCNGCAKEKQKELGNGNGYYHERKDEKDFLYVLNFNNKYIKVGRSFDVERRLGKNELQKDSGISNIIKLRIFTATHQEIYDLEQTLHEKLREKGFQYYLDWTNECFENDCLFILNKLLASFGLEEVM